MCRVRPVLSQSVHKRPEGPHSMAGVVACLRWWAPCHLGGNSNPFPRCFHISFHESVPEREQSLAEISQVTLASRCSWLFFLGEILLHTYPFCEQPIGSQGTQFKVQVKHRGLCHITRYRGYSLWSLRKAESCPQERCFTSPDPSRHFWNSHLYTGPCKNLLDPQKYFQSRFNSNANEGLWQEEKFPHF